MPTKEWYRKNKEKTKAYNKSYWRKWYLKNKAKRLNQLVNWRKSNKSYFNDYNRLYRQTNIERLKRRCRNIVYWAIRQRRLVRPFFCSNCGKECKPEAHHTDYSKPYEIVWLCRKCHLEADKQRKQGQAKGKL